MQNYYQILGFDHANVTQNEIRQAYINWVRKYYPNINFGDIYFDDRLKEINNANDNLSDAKKRLIYDNNHKASLVFNKEEIAKQKEQDELKHQEVHAKQAEKIAKQKQAEEEKKEREQQAQKQAEAAKKAKMNEAEELKKQQKDFEAQREQIRKQQQEFETEKEKIRKQQQDLAKKEQDLAKEKENLKRQQPNEAERLKREQEIKRRETELHREKEYLTAELNNFKHKEKEYEDRINFLHTENRILEEKLKLLMTMYPKPPFPPYVFYFIGIMVLIVFMGVFTYLNKGGIVKPPIKPEITEVIPPNKEIKKEKIQKYLSQIATKNTNSKEREEAKANLLKIVNELAKVYILAESDRNIIKDDFLLEDYVDDIILSNKVKTIQVVEIEFGNNEEIREITIKETEN
jgi:curved DNA-binding protein CbpA